jgi:oligopeptide/dipeptide ABC transporter ATP-binding protein
VKEKLPQQHQILEVKNLVKHYPVSYGSLDSLLKRERKWVRAVDGVSFEINGRETLGLVGESGSGKTTLGRSVLMLDRPTSGSVSFKGKSVSELKGEELRMMRKSMQVVFQNPDSSLNPRHKVREILLEPLNAFGIANTERRDSLLESSLKTVGLPLDSLGRLPHQFSGGQRQRIAIARALILNPEFMVLDEPTSALDSSVQAQILNLLRKIQDEYGISYLFISHNINVVRYMADRIAVMYAGKLVELGNVVDVLETPLHPYTSALIASVPIPGKKDKREAQEVSGEAPSPVDTPRGCRFHPRCRYAREMCSTTEPELREVERGHWAACHFAEEITSGKASENVIKPAVRG